MEENTVRTAISAAHAALNVYLGRVYIAANDRCSTRDARIAMVSAITIAAAAIKAAALDDERTIEVTG